MDFFYPCPHLPTCASPATKKLCDQCKDFNRFTAILHTGNPKTHPNCNSSCPVYGATDLQAFPFKRLPKEPVDTSQEQSSKSTTSSLSAPRPRKVLVTKKFLQTTVRRSRIGLLHVPESPQQDAEVIPATVNMITSDSFPLQSPNTSPTSCGSIGASEKETLLIDSQGSSSTPEVSLPAVSRNRYHTPQQSETSMPTGKDLVQSPRRSSGSLHGITHPYGVATRPATLPMEDVPIDLEQPFPNPRLSVSPALQQRNSKQFQHSKYCTPTRSTIVQFPHSSSISSNGITTFHPEENCSATISMADKFSLASNFVPEISAFQGSPGPRSFADKNTAQIPTFSGQQSKDRSDPFCESEGDFFGSGLITIIFVIVTMISYHIIFSL